MNVNPKEIAYVAGTSAAFPVAVVAALSVLGATATTGGVAMLLFASVVFGLAALFLTEKWVKASMFAMLPAVGVVLANVQVLKLFSAG